MKSSVSLPALPNLESGLTCRRRSSARVLQPPRQWRLVFRLLSTFKSKGSVAGVKQASAAGVGDDGSILDAVNLNNLDDWTELHNALG